jgi:hypothetical protein
MKKLVIMLVALMVCSVAYGLGPIGDPTATVGEGRMGFSYDYAEAEQDMDISGIRSLGGRLDSVDTTLHSGTLIYGVSDRFDVWGRMGFLDLNADNLEADSDRLLGVGARATIFESGDFSVGATGQANWLRLNTSLPGRKRRCRQRPPEEVDIEMMEIIIGVGPSIKLDSLSVYGSVNTYYLSGEIDVGSRSGRIKESNTLVGSMGASLALTDNISVHGEYQLGRDFNLWTAGVGGSF